MSTLDWFAFGWSGEPDVPATGIDPRYTVSDVASFTVSDDRGRFTVSDYASFVVNDSNRGGFTVF